MRSGQAYKVSVIVPNYNHAAYLKQRIDSVLGQTFTDFEVILLDDYSTDDSRSILDSYRDHPAVTHVDFNTVNSGSPFKQWQKGVAFARGEWIWIAESDDYADSRFLEEILAATDAYPRAGLIYCDSRIVDENGAVADDTFAFLKNKHFNTDRWSRGYVNNGVDEIENYLLGYGTINNTSAVLFKKDVLLKADPFDVEFRYIGDKYAFVKVLAGSDVAYVNKALNYYRTPFSTKHADRFIYYFYEQFLVFDWVHRQVKVLNQSRFFDAFYLNTRNSLFRNWNKDKVALYGKLWKQNRYLLIRSIMHNFKEGLRAGFRRITT